MNPYLVHIERSGQARQEIAMEDPSRPGRVVSGRAYGPYRVKVEYDHDIHDFAAAETWQCESMAAAEMLARELAKARPGQNVLVCELKSVAVCQPTAPVVTTYSDKGLLP